MFFRDSCVSWWSIRVLMICVAVSSGEVTTVSCFGDSLTSCSGVSPSMDFAYLSWREPLWRDFVVPRLGPDRIRFVGSRRGCNRRVDLAFRNATQFPNHHDAYFGRTATKLLQEIGSGRSLVVGEISMVLVGTNDFLLWGKANASAVAGRVVEIVNVLRRSGSKAVLVGIPPDIDFRKAKLKRSRAERWVEYRDRLGDTLRTSAGVVAVDFPGWNSTRHTYDGIHPNHEGERTLARSWFAHLLPLLVPASTTVAAPYNHTEAAMSGEAPVEHRERYTNDPYERLNPTAVGSSRTLAMRDTIAPQLAVGALLLLAAALRRTWRTGRG